jgi:hypothetical protein
VKTARIAVVLCAGLGLLACGQEADPTTPDINTKPPEEEEPEEVADIPVTLQAALADFGSCMNLEVWVKTGVYKLYGAEVEDGNGTNCMGCHSAPAGGVILSDDVLAMFEAHTKLPSVMRLVTGTVDERGQFRDLVPANRYNEKGTAQCLPTDLCHPEYTLPTHLQNALVEFVDESLDRWHSDSCNAPYTTEEE